MTQAIYTHVRTYIHVYIFAAYLTAEKYINRLWLPYWNAATATNTDSGIRNLILIHSVRVLQRWFRSRRRKCLCCRRRRLLYRPSHYTCSPNPIDRRLWYHCPSHQHTVASLFRASMGPTVRHSVTWGLYLRCHLVCLGFGPENGSPSLTNRWSMETMFTSFQGWKLCHCTVLIIWPVSPNVVEHRLIHQLSQWAKPLWLMPWAIWLHLGHFKISRF